MIKQTILVLALLFITGCAQISAGFDVARRVNDTVATGLITSMCGITVGAYYRLNNPVHKKGINMLCGADNQIELTARE